VAKLDEDPLLPSTRHGLRHRGKPTGTEGL